MKYLYQKTERFYIGARCPNCDQEFNFLSVSAKFVEVERNGKKVRLLCCGRCKIDGLKLQEKIKHIQLKEIDNESVQEDRV